LVTIDFSKNSYDEAEKNIKEAKLEDTVTQVL
jgi:predicted O-methyltransferase YrrM